MDTLAILLSKAIAKRKPLLKLTNAMRLVNGAGDDLKGLIIDRYGRHFAIQILDKRYHEKKDHVVHYLQKHCAAVYCIVKDRILSTASTPDAFVSQVYTDSASSTTIVEEYGLKFAVDLNDGLNSGLFLDMRKNRHMIAGQIGRAHV